MQRFINRRLVDELQFNEPVEEKFCTGGYITCLMASLQGSQKVEIVGSVVAKLNKK